MISRTINPREAVMIYKYVDGFRGNVPAAVAGSELARIEAARGGHLTPQSVVDEARPVAAPLHRCFDFNDTTAAEKYRIEQARALIRSVRVIDQIDGRPQEILHRVHVQAVDVGDVYMTTARVMSEPELRAQVEAEALAAYQALGKRYAHIVWLRDAIAAIERAARRQAARKRPPQAGAQARA